ncbi:MAG TPA: hypothetical protein ENK57_09350 [Polyangiaceae bacterium]|nr:hypothetical protein [Polyangiaceae bacterium]
MSDAGPPSKGSEPSWLGAIAHWGLRRPKLVVGVALVLLAVCALAMVGMPISTSRYKLVAADNPYQAKMLRFFERYGYPDSLVMVVDGGDDVARRRAVDALTAKLEQLPELEGRVLGQLRPEHVAEIMLVSQPDALQQARKRYDGDVKELIEGGVPAWLGALEQQLAAGLEGSEEVDQSQADDALRATAKLVRALDAQLAGDDPMLALAGFAHEEDALSITVDDAGYVTTTDGEHHLIALFPSLPGMEEAEVGPLVRRIRELRDATLVDGDVEANLTGLPAFVADEVSIVSRGLLETSLATTVGIVLLLLFAFRSKRYAILSLIPLGVGVVLTLAATRGVFGGLNLITSSFVPVLLALGIDFGVYVLARYGENVRDGEDTATAIAGALDKAGPGMLIGGVTTVCAFLMTTVIEFTAYSELGVITAIGLVMMVAVTFILLPPLIFIAGRGEKIESPELSGVKALPKFLRGARWAVLGGALLVTLALAPGWLKLSFNARYFDFLPEDTETSRGLDRIESDPNLSPVQASVGIDGVEEARKVVERLRALETVGTVQSGTDLLPELDKKGLAALRAGFAELSAPSFDALRKRERDLEELRKAVTALVDTVDEVAFAMRRGERDTKAIEELKKALGALRERVNGLEDVGTLTATEKRVADLLERAWTTAARVAERGGYLPTDLPPLFRNRFVSNDGKGLAIFANPKGNIWDAETAEIFARDVQSVAPEMSGLAVTVHEHMRMIKEGFAKASSLSIAVTLLILFIGFRRVYDVGFALLPVALGVAWMLGVMGYAGIRFDVANIVALPLITGVGVDAGAHMIHRWRQSAEANGGVACIEDIIRGTGAAVLVASLTTATGFATLMLGAYGGMKSLGLTMTLGITGALLGSLLIVPCLLIATKRAS